VRWGGGGFLLDERGMGMRSRRLWGDRFRAYRMWILERRPAAAPSGAPPSSSPERDRDALHSPAAADAPDAPVHFVLLDRHARRDWVVHRGDETDWRQFRVALEHDHDIVVARRGDQALGWAWLGYERIYLAPLGSELRLSDGTGYLYDAYVRPAERGRGIGHGLVAARCRRADALGLDRLLSHVLVGNAASLRTLQSHGFATVGRTVFLRAPGLRMWTREPVPARRRTGAATGRKGSAGGGT
jgi:ribosomal protein S18 acetylase RimI-like enzyme